MPLPALPPCWPRFLLFVAVHVAALGADGDTSEPDTVFTYAIVLFAVLGGIFLYALLFA